MAAVPGDDPLLPYLRSIRQIKQSHSDDKSKLLPYVSDCFNAFRDDERYKNDIRFLKVCIQYADCSPEPLKIISTLDEKGIGHDHALFYEAYATVLEGKRRFGDANNIYKAGLSRHAEPTDKLVNSYKLFRDRMESRKKRKQDQMDPHSRKNCSSAMKEDVHLNKESNAKLELASEVSGVKAESHKNVTDPAAKSHQQFETSDTVIDPALRSHQQMESCKNGTDSAPRSHLLSSNWYAADGSDISFEEIRLASITIVPKDDVRNILSNTSLDQIPDKIFVGSFGEETIQIRNFTAKAITGDEVDVEDARHHGLVDPTINTKEALQDILSMFRKPLDLGKKKETKKKTECNGLQNLSLDFPVFRDSDQPEESLFVYTDDNVEDNPPRAVKPPTDSGFFVFKDDDAPGDVQGGFSVFQDESPDDKLKSGMFNNNMLSKKQEESDLFVFRDEEEPENNNGKPGKGKSLGVHKSLSCGVENIIPQSPIC